MVVPLMLFRHRASAGLCGGLQDHIADPFLNEGRIMPNETTQPAEPKPFTVIPTPRQMSQIRFSPCGKFLFATGRDSQIHRWDVTQPLPQPEPLPEPDPKKKNAKPPKAPNPVFAKLPELTGHDGWVSGVVFHPQPDQQRCFSADSWGRLIGWSYADEPPRPAWNIAPAHDGWIRQLAISRDGQQLATCGKDKIIRLWSTTDGKKMQEITAQGEDVYSLAFHPDGKSLVAGDLKGIVKHWDLATNQLVREFDAKILYLLNMIQDVGGVRVLAFDTEGKTLAIAGAQPSTGGFVQASPIIKFVNWDNGQELQQLKLGENTEGFVHDLAYHPTGYWAGVCSGQPGRGRYFLHKVGDAAPFLTDDKKFPNCHSVAWHPTGSRLAVISNEGTYGQKRSMAREGIYPGNTSPIHILDIA